MAKVKQGEAHEQALWGIMNDLHALHTYAEQDGERKLAEWIDSIRDKVGDTIEYIAEREEEGA